MNSAWLGEFLEHDPDPAWRMASFAGVLLKKSKAEAAMDGDYRQAGHSP